MQIKIEVRGLKEVGERLARMPRDVQDRALPMALNKVAEKGRAEINRAIPQEFAVKASEVRQAVSLRKARSGELMAVIDIFGSMSRRGRSMNLVHFLEKAITLAEMRRRVKAGEGGNQTLRNGGVVRKALELRFKIKKAGGLKKIQGAFIGNKGRTVFVRTGKARLPIDPLQVIGFSQMFTSRRINERVMSKINADLPVEVDRALAAVLARMSR